MHGKAAGLENRRGQVVAIDVKAAVPMSAADTLVSDWVVEIEIIATVTTRGVVWCESR